jgi:hypothetical protein
MATARKTNTPAAADGWVSIGKASRMLGEARLTVMSRVVKGELTAQHIADRTIISRASLEKLLATREA